MKTAILYISGHGTVRWCAEEIQKELKDETALFDLKKGAPSDLAEFDRVILGVSIHAGNTPGRFRRFLKNREKELTGKKVALFLCSMEKSWEQFEKAFPESLREKAEAKGLFGGRMLPDRLGPFLRFVVKKVRGSLEAADELDTEALHRFVVDLQP